MSEFLEQDKSDVSENGKSLIQITLRSKLKGSN